MFSVVEQEDPTWSTQHRIMDAVVDVSYLCQPRFKKLLGLVQKDATPHPSWMQALASY